MEKSFSRIALVARKPRLPRNDNLSIAGGSSNLSLRATKEQSNLFHNGNFQI
jgi:hypothetical protein